MSFQGNSKYIDESVQWTPEEKSAWRLPAAITVSEWADKYRILDPRYCNEPGRWYTVRAAYLEGIMNALINASVEEITIMASSQVGKTECLYNMMAYIVDQDPAPTMLVMPSQTDIKEISKTRLLSMFECSPKLAEHLTNNDDDMTSTAYYLDNMNITFGWARSPSRLAQRSIRYLFLDETDKFPEFSGKEANPIDLAKQRTRTFWNRKIIKCSTPTTDDKYIYTEFSKSARHYYYVLCPACNLYQSLIFDQLNWPENMAAEAIRNDNAAYYECIYCKKQIQNTHKSGMIRKGRWLQEDNISQGKILDDSYIISNRHVGFSLNALYSPWMTFSEVAAEYLTSKSNTGNLMHFKNSTLGEPWRNNIEETKPDILMRKTLQYEAGQVPKGVVFLTAGVDVQKDHYYFIIRGWGIGEESWLILALRVESWDDIVHYLFKMSYPSYENPSQTFQVRLTCVDSGDRAYEVYDLCYKWRDKARPVKGYRDLRGVPYKSKKIEPDMRRKNSIMLYSIDTTYFKDKISRFVNADEEARAQWHLHNNVHPEYIRQFCNEQKVEVLNKKTGKKHEEWALTSPHAANHFFDCEVYATSAAAMLGVHRLSDKVYQPVYKQVQKPPNTEWIPEKKDWLSK